MVWHLLIIPVVIIRICFRDSAKITDRTVLTVMSDTSLIIDAEKQVESKDISTLLELSPEQSKVIRIPKLQLDSENQFLEIEEDLEMADEVGDEESPEEQVGREPEHESEKTDTELKNEHPVNESAETSGKGTVVWIVAVDKITSQQSIHILIIEESIKSTNVGHGDVHYSESNALNAPEQPKKKTYVNEDDNAPFEINWDGAPEFQWKLEAHFGSFLTRWDRKKMEREAATRVTCNLCSSYSCVIIFPTITSLFIAAKRAASDDSKVPFAKKPRGSSISASRGGRGSGIVRGSSFSRGRGFGRNANSPQINRRCGLPARQPQAMRRGRDSFGVSRNLGEPFNSLPASSSRGIVGSTQRSTPFESRFNFEEKIRAQRHEIELQEQMLRQQQIIELVCNY
uniref:Nucleotide-binding alpha-beta plait domain-containing protein n=1 Tax=Heterorhabditis bacteriophora TaxID=37862 RepID=A0A1I7XRR0_HETBA